MLLADSASAPHKPRILPGSWRPQYPWEHIAWINPPWDNEDFIWLDFPEAIFTGQGLLYLSHINPLFPVRFPDLPPVNWSQSAGKTHYERILPNGVSFRGSLTADERQCVRLTLAITNGSDELLTDIRLQTCLFLRAYYQLSTYTWDNKFIHTREQGWVNLENARANTQENGRYRFGWRGGHKIADLPVMACQATDDHLVAFSWLQDTYSLISNPKHPCIHADPAVPDLEPGASYELHGEIFFTDHGLKEIEQRYEQTHP